MIHMSGEVKEGVRITEVLQRERGREGGRGSVRQGVRGREGEGG